MHISPEVLSGARDLDRALERLTAAHTAALVELADGKVDYCISVLEAAAPYLVTEAKSQAAMGLMLSTLKFYMLSVKSGAGGLAS